MTSDQVISDVKNKTFKDFDLLGLEPFAINLRRHIVAEYPHVDGSLVISLNGRFGCGKSCFLEMFNNYLKNDGHEVVYVNAWKHDFFDEPIITLLSELLNHVEENKILVGDVSEALKTSLLSIVGSSAVVANQMIKKFTGIDVKEVAELTEKEIEERDIRLGNAIFKEYSEKKSLFDKLNESLEKYSSAIEKKPIYILVDELDRTRPDYAVKFIETLKHFFRTRGVVFVLAVDKSHLCASVKNLYGSEIIFSEYYRKFVHRNVSFPDISLNSIKTYTQSKVAEHFDSKSRGRFFVTDFNSARQNNICDLCIAFNLSPRQMDEMFRILSHYLGSQEEGQQGVFGWIISAILYSAIYLSDEEIALSISQGSYGYTDFINLLEEKGLIDKEDKYYGNWWAKMFIHLFSSEGSHVTHIDTFIKKCEPSLKIGSDEYKRFAQETDSSSSQALGTWGYSSGKISVIQQVGRKINQCLAFFDQDLDKN